MLSFDALAKKLGLSRPQLTALVREGLPHSLGPRGAKQFEPHAVAAWLQAQGKATRTAPPATSAPAQPPAPTNAGQRIATTRVEAAQAIGVSVRVFAEWMKEPGFPGKAGPPGRRDGHFPIEEIAAWCDRRQGTAPVAGSSSESPRERLLRLRADAQEIELGKSRGEVVDLVGVERLLRRTIATTKAVLSPLADELLLDLPAEIPADVREQLRARTSARLAEAFSNIAKLLEKDEEEDTMGAPEEGPSGPAAIGKGAGADS